MEIIGHQKEIFLLKKCFKENRLSHAYIFQGEENLGKKTIALEFIKFINCQANEVSVRPCGKCFSCQAFLKKWHPDLILIDGEKQSSIQISQIREIQYFLNQKSFFGSFKSVVIDQAERMTKDAQSCLLKTLEEPKGKTLLILITALPNLIMKTITSRCQKICFLPLPSQILIDFLKDKKIPERDKKELSFHSRGRPGKLMDYLLNPEKLEKEKEILKEILSLSKKDLNLKFQYLKILKDDPIKIIKLLTEHFRHLLISQFREKHPLESKKNDIYSQSKLEEITEFLNEVYFLISFTNINKKLALEMLMIKL